MYLDPQMHFQIKLKVTSPGLMKFQILLGKLQTTAYIDLFL